MRNVKRSQVFFVTVAVLLAASGCRTYVVEEPPPRAVVVDQRPVAVEQGVVVERGPVYVEEDVTYEPPVGFALLAGEFFVFNEWGERRVVNERNEYVCFDRDGRHHFETRELRERRKHEEGYRRAHRGEKPPRGQQQEQHAASKEQPRPKQEQK